MKWFFYWHGGRIVLHARAENGGTIGDAYSEIEPGRKWFGLHYDDFAKAGAGVVVVKGNKARIAA
jgi:hypothetical protein